jgi:hypothetical protein
MRTADVVRLASNQTGALTTAAQVNGGLYAILCAGTLGTSPALNISDGTNQILAATPSTTYATVQLPPGQVQLVLASGASGAYVTLARIPND